MNFISWCHPNATFESFATGCMLRILYYCVEPLENSRKDPFVTLVLGKWDIRYWGAQGKNKIIQVNLNSRKHECLEVQKISIGKSAPITVYMIDISSYHRLPELNCCCFSSSDCSAELLIITTWKNWNFWLQDLVFYSLPWCGYSTSLRICS